MTDRSFNRDRSRPYDENNEDDFNERYRSRNRSDRDYEFDRDESMQNRGYGGDYGYSSGGYGRGYGDYGYGSGGYGRAYPRGGRSGYGYSGRQGRGYGGSAMGGYGGDYGYEEDFDRWNRGRYSGYGRGFGQQGGFSQDRYNRGRYDRSGFDQGGYGQQYGYGSDFESDLDYDYDTEPVSWTYTEFWMVPGPYSGVGPQGYRRSDERIHEDICERMTQHGRLNAREVQIQVQNGEVTLSGTVDSRESKRIAEDIADSVSGVSDVNNQLRVQERQFQRSQLSNQQGQGMGQQSTSQQGQSQQTGVGQQERQRSGD